MVIIHREPPARPGRPRSRSRRLPARTVILAMLTGLVLALLPAATAAASTSTPTSSDAVALGQATGPDVRVGPGGGCLADGQAGCADSYVTSVKFSYQTQTVSFRVVVVDDSSDQHRQVCYRGIQFES
ncbi:MAG: hypothetical protein ACYCXA_12920 [Actinomycetes bacterium]